jgi:hypothetical protein
MLRALRSVVFCLPLLAAGAAVAGPAQAPEETVSATTFVLRGRGWGHGVGMGQWGAYGQAKRGVAYDEILAHYYSGTKLTKVRSEKVRVLLAEGSGPYRVSSEVPFRVEDGAGEIHELAPGSYRVGKALALAVEPAAPPVQLKTPLTFAPGSKPLTLGAKPYRGSIVVQRVEKRLQVVNVVGIDPYFLSGRARTGTQAIKAQAWRHARTRCDAATGDPLRGHAVGLQRRRRGQAATGPSSLRVVLTFDSRSRRRFFSSSGGRTAGVEASSRADADRTSCPFGSATSSPTTAGAVACQPPGSRGAWRSGVTDCARLQ